MDDSKKRYSVDLSEIRKLLKEKKPIEVQQMLGFKNRQCFYKFCEKNFIKIPSDKKEVSCNKVR